MKSFSHLIGIPYSDKNCWDLPRAFYKDVLGVELKKYYENDISPSTSSNLIFSNAGDFARTIDPKFGDLITIKIRGIECHLAIFINKDQILHTNKKTGSVIDRKNKWEKVITGYYTLKGNSK